MEPSLTWLDLTSRDRDVMRRALDLFSEGTVDEMGLGSLRDAFADALFPGTSSIQTRLRYMLFVPWIYQRLEAARVTSDRVATEARAAEIRLIAPLAETDDSLGVIGVEARGALGRLPSSVYWAGLKRWGIFQRRQSQGWYHKNFASLADRRAGVGRADDPGVTWSREATWHPRLPDAPVGFPREASFALSTEEAEFLRGRIEESCAGSLLAWLAREGSATPADAPWEEPAATSAPDVTRTTLELARRFSLHVEGVPLLYNLSLAELRHERHGTDEELIQSYRDQLTKWGAAEDQEAPFDTDALWSFALSRGTGIGRVKAFIETWSARANAAPAAEVASDGQLRRLVEAREWDLKGTRARLSNPQRLLDWSGSVGVGRMDFRWSRVRQLLADLHGSGAAREPEVAS